MESKKRMKRLAFIALLLISTLASAQTNNFKWIVQQTYTAAGTNTYTATVAGFNLGFGAELKVLFTNGNTGASTLAINGGAAQTLRKSGGSALSSGDILAGATYRLTYDGTYWQVLGIGGSGGGSVAWGDITSTPTTIAGYGITDYNSLGDARWIKLGGTSILTSPVRISNGNYGDNFVIDLRGNDGGPLSVLHHYDSSSGYTSQLKVTPYGGSIFYALPTSLAGPVEYWSPNDGTSMFWNSNGWSFSSGLGAKFDFENDIYMIPGSGHGIYMRGAGGSTADFNLEYGAGSYTKFLPTAGGITLTLPSANSTLATRSLAETFLNKTISLGSNTISGTKAQFNTAVTDGDFEDVANKATTLTTMNNTLYPTTASISDDRTVTGTGAIVQSDNFKTIYFNSATPFNFTIDQLSAKSQVAFMNIGAGTVTFVAGTGVTITGAATLAGASGDVVPSGFIIYRSATNPILQVSGHNDPDIAVIKKKKVSLTSSDILTLNSSAVELLQAPGSGFANEILSISFRYNYATAAYATNTTLSVLYSTVEVTNHLGILNQTSDKIKIASSGINYLGDESVIENQAVYLSTQVGNPTAGGGSLDVYITYRIIQL